MRDDKGRFTIGNRISRLGGQARATKVSAARLSEIGRQGWLAFVAKYFRGDEDAAKQYASELFMWASDAPYRGTFAEKFLKPVLPAPDQNYDK